MEKTKRLTPKRIVLLAVVLALVVALTLLGLWLAREFSGGIHEILAEEEYTYVNPDETKAQTDPGMRIDGVLDEEVYQESNWLHLQNNDGGNNVNIAMTSHFGEQGMYFVFDVTESVPIYVNLDRAPYLNSCIELYLIPPYLSKLQGNSMFEIDLLPTGDMIFKKSNGKYGYENVASTDDIMACLGAVTKGGPVNTPECYGYALELFIPWDYMRWLGIDVAAIQDGFVYINPAHITSNNYTGTDNNLDRYWYHYAQQLGADFADVPQYFRFNGEGIMGTSPLNLENGEHHTFTGGTGVLPGMKTPVTVTPAEGYALTSVLVDGQEQLHNVDFGEDGSVTLWIRGTGVSQTVTARTEAISEGKKTLRGKLRVSGILSEVLPGTLVTYTGPLGEKPVELDAEGNFELKDLDQGYYVLKVEKEGYSTFTRSICLNRDVYTELTLKAPVFYTTRGACWILDEESFGILYKTGGAGHVMSHASYNDFTFETYIKYDPELAKQSDDDNHLQQRSGIRILFSNGKYWHIDLMLENGQYVVQYAKHAGKDSIFNWRNVHALTQEQINKYTSPEGIKLTVMRQENRAAICLDGKILFVEELPKEYASLTAQMGMEAWIANSTVMKVPFSIKPSAAVEKVPGAIFNAAQTWDISSQHQGIVRKTGVAGNTTWLESVINCNDVTTTARDLSPNTGDYSMIYIFRFSNGEQFRVRLNHTDTDGKYRIQSMAGSTVFDAWRNHYTLTDQQAAKVMGKGISYRVLVSGTTAHVFLDGEEVCTYDLSKVVATGKPSGIEKATVKIALRLDGNLNKTTEIPFKLASTASVPQTPTQPEEPEEPDEPVDPEKRVEFVIPQLANGTVKTVKAEYAVGSKVTLAVTPAAGYVQKLTINGKPLILDWKTNTYTFIATEKRYEITGSFVEELSWTPADTSNVRYDLNNQGHNVINVYYPNDTSSWWADIDGEYSAFTVKAKNYLSVEDSKEGNGNTGFAVALRMTLSNGKNYAFRIFNDKGTYACDYYGAAGSATGWGGWQNIHSYASQINGEGVDFKLERINANTLQISLNGTVIFTYTMEGVTENDKVVSVGLCHYGNKGVKIEVPFVLAE